MNHEKKTIRELSVELLLVAILALIFALGFTAYVLSHRNDMAFFRPTCNDLERRSDINRIMPYNLKFLNRNKDGVYCSSITH